MNATTPPGPAGTTGSQDRPARQTSPSTRDGGRRPWILLVEDNPDLAQLARYALAGAAPAARVQHAADGKQALAALADATARPGGRRPDLVLLDLKLPGMEGTGVLSRMRDDPALQHVPVVILSSCSSPEDIQRAYAAGANSYVVKPVEFTDLKTTIESVASYWLSTNLPAAPA